MKRIRFQLVIPLAHDHNVSIVSFVVAVAFADADADADATLIFFI